MTADGSNPVSARVLLVAPSPPPYGGMALQARLLEKQLRHDGHDVVFVASNLPAPAALRFCDDIPGVRTAVRLFVFTARLWNAARSGVVHVFAASWVYFFCVVAPAVLVARARGRRVILNYRGGAARQFFRWWGWAARPFFHLAGAVTAPSTFLAETIGEQFRIPVRIVPNILDLSAFAYRPRKRFRPAMVVARHLEPIYDVESVLLAFAKCQERYPDASLIIAGGGSEEERLRRLAASRGLANVRWMGQVPHAELPKLYEACDILINASLVDNFPGALMEAASAGLAVVSTAAGGIPHIFENGKTALLVQPGDWNALAEAVQMLVETPGLGEQLTRAAVRMAALCDWKEVRTSLYAAYGFASTLPAEARAAQR